MLYIKVVEWKILFLMMYFFTDMNKSHFFMTSQRKHLYFFIPELFLNWIRVFLTEISLKRNDFMKNALYKSCRVKNSLSDDAFFLLIWTKINFLWHFKENIYIFSFRSCLFSLIDFFFSCQPSWKCRFSSNLLVHMVVLKKPLVTKMGGFEKSHFSASEGSHCSNL